MPTTPSLQDTALDHLRVIRTLMERASLYRAVSAPAALAGGGLALALAVFGFSSAKTFPTGAFILSWIGILAVASAFNFFLLSREAGGRGQPLVTDGLRMALRAIVPPMLSGGVLGLGLMLDGQRAAGALVWIICYGLALQATVGFAPPSIIRLARAFLIAGQLLAVLFFAKLPPTTAFCDGALASLLLGLTFGAFHLVYGLGVLLGKPAAQG